MHSSLLPTWLIIGLTASTLVAAQQTASTRCEPDPMTSLDGTIVATAEQWRTHRRPEILELFRKHMFGRAPKAQAVSVEDEEVAAALGGAARRKQWRMRYGAQPNEGFDVLAYLPADRSGPVPVFLAFNFYGNQTIHDDPGIRLPTSWLRNNKAFGITENLATEASRGVRKSRWPVEKILARGYGLVTVYYGDIDPDFDDGFKNGVHGASERGRTGERPADAGGSIAAWAWGLSRVLDRLVADADVRGDCVAVLGHSRLGKTSLWAGAQDERFAMVISNESGCGGAAYSRRRKGETVKVINSAFPHWFCRAFHAYGDREHELPLDQHLLVAAIAPRPAYVASAAEDLWADPEGEFLSVLGADPVYRLLGTEGLPTAKMPEVDEPVHGQLAYHVRAGKHDLRWQDWQQYLTFADKHFAR